MSLSQCSMIKSTGGVAFKCDPMLLARHTSQAMPTPAGIYLEPWASLGVSKDSMPSSPSICLGLYLLSVWTETEQETELLAR